MARSSNHIYNPKTGEWSKNTSSNSETKKKGKSSDDNSTSDNLTATSSDKNDSKGSVEKKYNKIQVNTLTGTLSYIVTENTIKLKAGDTVKLKGLGSHLSGKYYVKEVVRQLDANGYSHTATVIKTDFGEALKLKPTKKTNKKGKKKSSSKSKTKKVKSTSMADSNKRTYTVKKGDSIYKIAKQFYKDSSKYTKIYDMDTNKVVKPNQKIHVGQVLIIT